MMCVLCYSVKCPLLPPLPSPPSSLLLPPLLAVCSDIRLFAKTITKAHTDYHLAHLKQLFAGKASTLYKETCQGTNTRLFA